MAGAAYLRVYVPEDQAPGAPARARPSRGWPPRVLTRGSFGVWHEPVREDAFAIERDGVRYVCPRTPRLRMLEGLIAFHRAYLGPTASVLVPEPMADRAARELDKLHSRAPGARSHILTAPFYVPLRWFAAFRAEDRELVQATDGLTIRYRTRLGEAVRRLEHAADVVEAVGFEDAVVEQVRDVARWLAPFPEDAIVELDYGGTAALFEDGELAVDESAADVGASVAALERGDFDKAGEHYARAARRWERGQVLANAN
jgi:hypothetical protein